MFPLLFFSTKSEFFCVVQRVSIGEFNSISIVFKERDELFANSSGVIKLCVKESIYLKSNKILCFYCHKENQNSVISHHILEMAQSKLNDLAGKFGKGGPPGLTTGLKVLAGLGALAYGVNQSLYTGKQKLCYRSLLNIF